MSVSQIYILSKLNSEHFFDLPACEHQQKSKNILDENQK